MRFSSYDDPTARDRIVRPFFFNDEVIGLLDGDYVQGRVPRSAVTAVRREVRLTCRRPIVAAIVGLAMIGTAVLLYRTAPQEPPPPANHAYYDSWLPILEMLMRFAALGMAIVGPMLLVWAARTRKETWIVFELGARERPFALREDLPAPAVALIHLLFGGMAPGQCLRCGYDLRATPDRCPECGSPTRALEAAARLGGQGPVDDTLISTVHASDGLPVAAVGTEPTEEQ